MTTPLYLYLATTTQLLNRGHSPHTLRKKLLEKQLIRVRKSVLAPHDLWIKAFLSERYIAQCYAWSLVSTRAVFSHASAAALLGLSLLNVPQLIYCYTNATSRGGSPSIRLFPRLDDDVRLVRSEHGLTCTDILTTVNDCARTLDLQSALVIANSALHKRLVNSKELITALNAGGRGSRNSRNIAEWMSEKCESPGETLLMLRLREMKLPLPEQQYEVYVPQLGRAYRLDGSYVEQKIALEFDGAVKMHKFGATDQVLIKERFREKALQNAGWIVVRFSWEMVTKRPWDIEHAVKNAFQARGIWI